MIAGRFGPRVGGQAVLEFLISATLLSVAVTASGWTLYAEWNRAKCAYLVFESAHARLMGSLKPPPPTVRVEEDAREIRGSSRCGSANETVSLRKLEEIRW
jgi:hypothetical protein